MLPHTNTLTVRNAVAEERGVILLTFAFSCLALLTLIGLAVDSANLYLARLSAQSAADAGALSGLGTFIATTTDQRDQTEAANAAIVAANANLIANGYGRGPMATVPSFNGQQMVLDVEINVPLYVMGGLSGLGIGATRTVRARGIAAVRDINVALVLDTSDSMACPSVSPDPLVACPCASPDQTCNQGPGSGAKIQNLIAASQQFVDYFQPGRDAMNLTVFGHGAELLRPFPVAPLPDDMENIKQEIQGLEAHGTTNMFDGLFTAYMDARRRNRTEDLFVVLFTDGAPTASRFIIDRNQLWPGVPPNRRDYRNNVLVDNGLPSWANYDWITWSLVSDTRVTFPNVLYVTPPPRNLGTDSNQPFWNKRTYAAPLAQTPPATIVGSGGNRVSKSDQVNQTWFLRGGPNNSDRFLRNPIIRMPDNTLRRLGRRQLWTPVAEGTEGPPAASDSFNWAGWIPEREHLWMFTDMAIMMADFIRQNGGMVYVIGYGPPAEVCPPGNPACGDPYQNVTAAHVRKDITNRRLAATACGWNDPPFFGRDVEFTIQQLLRDATKAGEYFPTDTPQNLQEAFDKIARSIKLRRASNIPANFPLLN